MYVTCRPYAAIVMLIIEQTWVCSGFPESTAGIRRGRGLMSGEGEICMRLVVFQFQIELGSSCQQVPWAHFKKAVHVDDEWAAPSCPFDLAPMELPSGCVVHSKPFSARICASPHGRYSCPNDSRPTHPVFATSKFHSGQESATP